MTYKELTEKIQSWLAWNGGKVEGYSSQQERMAVKPCHDVLKACGVSELYLERSTGAGIFYDIYADVSGMPIRLGYFGNNGTIRRQTIETRFMYLNHGDEEFDVALIEIAKEKLQEKADVIAGEIEQLTVKLEEAKKRQDKVYATLAQLSAKAG